MLFVMKLHDLPRNERLESIIGVWEIRESVCGHDGFDDNRDSGGELKRVGI